MKTELGFDSCIRRPRIVWHLNGAGICMYGVPISSIRILVCYINNLIAQKPLFTRRKSTSTRSCYLPCLLKALLLRNNIWVHCKRKKTGNSSCLIAYEETPVAAVAVYERAMVANATISAVIRFGRCIT